LQCIEVCERDEEAFDVACLDSATTKEAVHDCGMSCEIL